MFQGTLLCYILAKIVFVFLGFGKFCRLTAASIFDWQSTILSTLMPYRFFFFWSTENSLKRPKANALQINIPFYY